MQHIELDTIFCRDTVLLDTHSFKDKNEAFIVLSKQLQKAGVIQDYKEFIKALEEREGLGPTYMGNAIGLPHGKSLTVKQPGIIFCRVKKPFLYESCGDSGMVKYIFMLAIAEDQSGESYMRVLASLASLLAHEEFINQIAKVETYEEFIEEVKQFHEGG